MLCSLSHPAKEGQEGDVNAAINSDSVELDAVMVQVLLLHAIAPPEKVKTHPVIDLLFHSSEP